MKKLIILFISVACLISILLVINSKNKEVVEIDKFIISELIDNGIKDGKYEFVYQVKNVGKDGARLVFHTHLEYNVTLRNLDGNPFPDGIDAIENLGLGDKDGRTVTLKQGEKISYPVHIHIDKIPKGNYEIVFSSNADNVATRVTRKFNIE